MLAILWVIDVESCLHAVYPDDIIHIHSLQNFPPAQDEMSRIAQVELQHGILEDGTRCNPKHYSRNLNL